MFRNLGAPEIILILVVLVLLFGAKRLPDAARSLGRSMRIFKSEVKEMGQDDEDSSASKPAPREVEGRIVDPTPGTSGTASGTTAGTQHATTPGERADRDQ